MKIIRYILSHGLLLVFLVAIGFAYYYRTQLFSDTINQRIDGVMQGVTTTARDIAEVFGYEKEQQTTAVMTENSEPTDASIAVTSEESANETQGTEVEEAETTDAEAVTDSSTETRTQVAEDNAGTEDNKSPTPAETSSETQADDEPVMQASVDEASTSEPAEAESNVDSDKQAAASSQAQLIDQARLAFHSGEIEKSISLYQQLGELDPANPNVFGELGNIFYSQGKWKQAGEAYYQAASLLLEQGQNTQVNYLFRVIQGLDQESAKKLEEKLTQ